MTSQIYPGKKYVCYTACYSTFSDPLLMLIQPIMSNIPISPWLHKTEINMLFKYFHFNDGKKISNTNKINRFISSITHYWIEFIHTHIYIKNKLNLLVLRFHFCQHPPFERHPWKQIKNFSTFLFQDPSFPLCRFEVSVAEKQTPTGL